MNSPGKLLIAVVDDDESVCRALGRLVRSLGMDAQTFARGREFVDLLEAAPSFNPDCVVLDIQMPDLNGIETQNEIRRWRPRLPVIFITAHDEPDARTRAIAGGAVAFLRKPFDDALFIHTLTVALPRNVQDKEGDTHHGA